MGHNWRHFFQNRRRYCIAFAFTYAYWQCLSKWKSSDSEIVRMGAAGSLMTNFVEISFYLLDTVNTRSKIMDESISSLKLLDNVLKEEGATALVRGVSATYYGSVLYGGVYFYSYTWLKCKGHEFVSQTYLPLLHFCSGFVSEYSALTLYYPFEKIKVRLQTQSHAYYNGLMDGFKDLLKNEGFFRMYKGYFWYALHYSVNYSTQMAIFESQIARFK